MKTPIGKLKLTTRFYCDCCEILNLLQKSKSTNPDEIEIDRLIGLLSYGEFLPTVQNDWMDGFRSWFANEVIDGLGLLLNGNAVKSNFSLRYHLAECILVYDPLNDEAFAVKMFRLVQPGQKRNGKKTCTILSAAITRRHWALIIPFCSTTP